MSFASKNADASSPIRNHNFPRRVMDAHHHFYDTTEEGNGKTFQAFFASLLPNERYLPSHYHNDVVLPLQKVGTILVGSVHVEAIPDDGVQEVQWVDSLSKISNDSDCTVQAIVASCDLTIPSIDQDLERLVKASPKVRGVRWILDCVGPYEPNTATHIATTRHNGIDYLRGSHGPGTYHGVTIPDFERGFALLAKYNLSFDLQCAPVQLLQAATLCQCHPQVPVCIDHLGKPKTLLGPDNENDASNDNRQHTMNTMLDARELETWRKGMRVMAALPHVYVKLSMLGYAIPGWIQKSTKRDLIKSLVQEVIQLFSPQRCMVAWNWHKDAAVSDSGGMSQVGPSAVEYLEFIAECLEGYAPEEQDYVFYKTAAAFYRVSIQ